MLMRRMMGKTRTRKPTASPATGHDVYAPERIVLSGVPVPRIAHLEMRGANSASFRVLTDIPRFLGGSSVEPREKVVMFRRTSREIGGLAVFEPEDQASLA